eukprot:6180194-Pleurochrysis_carterae.AAC.2
MYLAMKIACASSRSRRAPSVPCRLRFSAASCRTLPVLLPCQLLQAAARHELAWKQGARRTLAAAAVDLIGPHELEFERTPASSQPKAEYPPRLSPFLAPTQYDAYWGS